MCVTRVVSSRYGRRQDANGIMRARHADEAARVTVVWKGSIRSLLAICATMSYLRHELVSACRSPLRRHATKLDEQPRVGSVTLSPAEGA